MHKYIKWRKILLSFLLTPQRKQPFLLWWVTFQALLYVHTKHSEPELPCLSWKGTGSARGLAPSPKSNHPSLAPSPREAGLLWGLTRFYSWKIGFWVHRKTKPEAKLSRKGKELICQQVLTWPKFTQQSVNFFTPLSFVTLVLAVTRESDPTCHSSVLSPEAVGVRASMSLFRLSLRDINWVQFPHFYMLSNYTDWYQYLRNSFFLSFHKIHPFKMNESSGF